AAKAAPDGYTMVTVIAGYAANVTLYAGKLPFDPRKDLVPVSLAAVAPLILTANTNFPAKDVRELIAYARANPGKVNFGSSGIGAAAHLTTELLKQTAGIDMVHIPCKGTAPALTALMANDIQILVDVPSTLMPHVRGGKIKALAMFSAKRLQGDAAVVPTMAEAGGPPLESSTWVMFMAPAGTPREIVNRLSAETAKAINESDIKDRFTQIGIEPGGGTPEQAAKFLADGCTLFGAALPFSVIQSLYKTSFDVTKDFAPITLAGITPNLLVAYPSAPVNSVKELIAYAKNNPGKLNYASTGNGTSNHLSF